MYSVKLNHIKSQLTYIIEMYYYYTQLSYNILYR